MRIKDIIVTPIAISDPPLLNASGLHAPYAIRIITEIISDDGFSGVSEIPCDPTALKILDEVKKIKDQIEPYNFEGFREILRKRFGDKKEERGDQSWDTRSISHVESALEVAIFDLLGKKHKKRVCDLLGGAKREAVPFSGYLFFKYKGAGGELGFDIDENTKGWDKKRQEEALTPEQIVEQAKAMIDEFGFESLKLKAGILEPRLEVDSILALKREFGKNTPLRIDPNAIWSFETALKFGKEMEGVIEYLEDPVRGQEEMARLKKVVNIPFATNMCTTSFEDLNKSMELNSEDIILLDHHFWGGFTPALKMAEMASGLGRGISMHSNSHTGVSMAAMVHFGASIPHLASSLDTHYPWQKDDIIKGEKIKIENGSVKIPIGYGLGVELDKEKLAIAHKNYLKCGITKRNDEVEMQKINPSWKFSKVRY
jgi:glucarate dehydratase